MAGVPTGSGFFAIDDPRGELIAGLLYLVLPMAVCELLCRLGLYLRTKVTGRRPRFAPGPVSAMIGVLSESA
jgi:hypothetical protein